MVEAFGRQEMSDFLILTTYDGKRYDFMAMNNASKHSVQEVLGHISGWRSLADSIELHCSHSYSNHSGYMLCFREFFVHVRTLNHAKYLGCG